MKQKERSFSCSHILIPLLFTLDTEEIHHHIFIKYYLQFIYLSFEHNHIIISQYIIIKQNYHIIIIISVYHHIIFKQNHHIIIIISVYHHIIFKQNHHIIIIKQNHHIIFKQNHHIIIIKQNHHIIFKQNHHIIIIKQNHHYHTNIIIISYKIITGEIILNYRRIIKNKLSLIIGSKTHPDPLCTNQFPIRNC